MTRHSGTGMLLLLLSAAAAAQSLPVGHFSQGDLSGWEEKVFDGETRYRLTETARGQALCTRSEGTASGLYRRLTVDLNRTPYLHWSWRVDQVFEGLDETRRPGDDYPARVYVVKKSGLFFWRTRSLVYVWSSSQPEGSLWESPYTAQVKMIAVRSGPRETGQWQRESRNVATDFRRAFGEEIDRIDAVAIMTDTDNSDGEASACYGDIRFGDSATPP